VLLEEGLAVARGLGDPRGIGWSLHILGIIRETQGRHKQAAVLHEESLSVFRAMDHAWGIAAELFRLGGIAHARGDFAQALAQYAECLRMTRDMGDRYGIADPLQGLGAIRASSGTTEHLEQGARLIGVADALREAFGGPPLPVDRAEYDRRRASVSAKLGMRAFALACAVGREIALSAVSLDQVIAETLAWVGAMRVQPGRPAEVHSGATPMSLTPRERQVAALLARGCTNSQIAAELVTGERTAEWHVANILSKLGLTSRAQAAVWAITHVVADGAASSGSNK
jgi:non-specific serine/threonine protein kinase